jgi:ABC-2 type transport system permease protein
MMGRWAELVFGPFRASWRAGVAWGIGLVALVVSTVAFWPAFKGASGITEAMAQLPPALVQAFGLQGFGTPAGYLRGGLYELIVPLLIAAAGIMLANGSMAGEEDAGRLELFLAQHAVGPLHRTVAGDRLLAGRAGTRAPRIAAPLRCGLRP